jgi:hypothetical protein
MRASAPHQDRVAKEAASRLTQQVEATCFQISEDEVLVSAIGNNPNVLAPSQSQSTSSSSGVSFQQAIDQYTQDTTSGVGGTSSGTNPTQTVNSNLISSLLQMQS